MGRLVCYAFKKIELMKPYFRPAKVDDVYVLYPKIREVDVEEVKATIGLNIKDGLMASYQTSDETYTMVADDGDLVGMFGLTKTADPLISVVWMLCTERLPQYSKTFIKLSKQWVIEQNKKHSILMNYVDARNITSIKWLKHLGFVLINRVEKFGVDKKPFYEFVRIN